MLLHIMFYGMMLGCVSQVQWPSLAAATWEDLVRSALGRLKGHDLENVDVFAPARRWWQGSAPEWDAVTIGESGCLLVAKAKWSDQPFTKSDLDALTRALVNRPLPVLKHRGDRVERALCVPETVPRVPTQVNGVWIVTGRHVLDNG